RKVRGELMRLNQPGMGVRFLSVEDLVRELVPAGYSPENLPAPPPPPEAAAEPEPLPHRPPQPAPPRPAAAPIPTPREEGGTFAVHFLSPAEFLEVYRRDILNGGLFVTTRFPGRLQETVTVELHPPFPLARPVLVRARVVQRFEPTADAFGPNLLAGMGVELLDLATVVDNLKPYVQG
ncbi:MAG TPA: hypothetical protein VFR31_21395, partial [Thermoanaerobaculia bacterium]|nr:hypothetical protein [Thermoanaerobaculia bacterium]